MSYIETAKRELELLGYDLNQTEEDPNKWVCENVLELLEVFSKQGHSGSSAPYVIDMFSKLANHKPLSPITGEAHEWVGVSEDTFQNNRCSNIFKRNGVAYNIDGYAFWHWAERELWEDEEGYPDVVRFKSSFTSNMSCKLVEFPYTSEEPEYVEVDSFEVNKETGEKEVGSGWWETVYPEDVIKNKEKFDGLLGE